MGWPQPDTGAVETALGWLREQDPRLTLDALGKQLRAAGYAQQDVNAAIAARQAELDAALPPGSDLRGRAGAILVVTFLATWGIISLALVTGESMSFGAVLILGAVLLPMLLLGLAIVRESRRLQRGVAGAMVMVFIVPFIYLVVVAGLCVATTNPFS
jgi:Flp pilus assembly protein TadB